MKQEGHLQVFDLALATRSPVFIGCGKSYTKKEYLQFEDDEYYYYVKAVPKMSIAIPEKKVKKISSGGRNARRRR